MWWDGLWHVILVTKKSLYTNTPSVEKKNDTMWDVIVWIYGKEKYENRQQVDTYYKNVPHLEF